MYADEEIQKPGLYGRKCEGIMQDFEVQSLVVCERCDQERGKTIIHKQTSYQRQYSAREAMEVTRPRDAVVRSGLSEILDYWSVGQISHIRIFRPV